MEDITVVSLEQAVAAPFASRQLADLGARVIKVERPDGGDFARNYDSTAPGTSSAFLWLNRGKESIALDIKSEDGRHTLERLLARADVFIQNLSPAAARRARLDPDSLAERHPRLIACAVSGYGDTGPLANAKAYDLLVQAETGIIALTGDADTMAKVGISIADIAAGSYVYSSVLAALLHRFRTGQVLPVRVSLFDALTEWLGYPLYYAHYSGREPERRGTRHATIAPYGDYRTGDGERILLAVQSEREWERFCRVVLEDPALATDPRFGSQQDRVAHSEALNTIIESRFGRLDQNAALALLEQADIAVARLNGIGDLSDHEQITARNRWIETPAPGGPARTLLPPWLPEPHGRSLGGVPAVGEHTEAILGWLRRVPATGTEAAAGKTPVSASTDQEDRPL